MKLADLPHFTVSAAHLLDGAWVLDGTFDHLATVREGRSWLYLSGGDSRIGDLVALDRSTMRARFRTMDPTPPPAWLREATLPWVDGYWQARHIAIILDEDHGWGRMTFAARDALESHVPGWRQLREAKGAIPAPGETILPGAWDHEHCMLCNARIDPGFEAYTDDENNWLCVRCHDSYAGPHDLGFLIGDA